MSAYSPRDHGGEQLLRLCEQIRGCVPDEEFHELLHQLYTQSMRYLESEEQQLRAQGDPGLPAHRVAHDSFHETFLGLMVDASAGRASPFAVGDFVLQWWYAYWDPAHRPVEGA